MSKLTELKRVLNDAENKISSLKIEMSKEINVTKCKCDIEEKFKLTLLMKPIMHRES